MNHQIELGYLVVELADPRAADAVFGDVVGLVAGEPTAGASTWRNDDRAQRIVIETGPANDAIAVGFEAVDRVAFDATVARLAAHGSGLEEGDRQLCARRRVERLVRTRAPWGVDVELVVGSSGGLPFDSTLVPGGFHTHDVGFGHVVFATTAFEDSVAFLTAGLGFRQSDWIVTELAPGIELVVRFFHCNARHHTVALAHAPFELPQRLHHVMFETNSRDDVGAAFDRAWASDLAIPNGLGRHDNDGMFSFYLQTPAGFQVEVGHGARAVDEDWTDDRRYDRISVWGHQPLRLS